MFKIKKYNCDYETWKLLYDKELSEMLNLFCLNFSKIHPELGDYLNSDEFYNYFCKFIKKSSSGKNCDFLQINLKN